MLFIFILVSYLFLALDVGYLPMFSFHILLYYFILTVTIDTWWSTTIYSARRSGLLGYQAHTCTNIHVGKTYTK